MIGDDSVDLEPRPRESGSRPVAGCFVENHAGVVRPSCGGTPESVLQRLACRSLEGFWNVAHATEEDP